ncbi:MAG: hypothetical protein RBU27_07145 [Bacteroidota bacterium]|nr:hypothetical protein [Bacteroidota bacterium]
MKHFLFALALFIALFFALRVLSWAVSNVLLLAAVAVIIYVGVRMLRSRRGTKD